jgi:hypothetical protein
MISGVIGEDLAHAQRAIQVVALRHDGDALLRADGIGHHIDTADGGSSAGGQNPRRQDADGRRFARAVRPQQPKGLAAPHAERDVVYRVALGARKALHQVLDLDGLFLRF